MAELCGEVTEFLSSGTAPGCWVSSRPTADRWSLPCGSFVDNGELVFNAGRDTAKGRALARDSRVVICVDDPHPPYSFVQLQGTASATVNAADLPKIATRIGARYMGAHRATEFGRRNAVPGELVVRVRPSKVVSAFNIAD